MINTRPVHTDAEEFFNNTCADGGGPAFPFQFFGAGMEYTFSGLNMREYYAGRMMAARLTYGYSESPEKAAQAAVAFADALIAELKK